jgi:ribosomal 30S subunit maturation factor RimM
LYTWRSRLQTYAESVEAQRSPDESPASFPSNELWGREVYDAAGSRLGTIDSVVRTFRGGAKAIVKNGRLSSMFVDLVPDRCERGLRRRAGGGLR